MHMNCALLYPPLDEEAPFGRTGIDMLNFFDDIDDEGNKMDKPRPRRTGRRIKTVIEVFKPNWDELCALKGENIISIVPKSTDMSKSTLDDMDLELNSIQQN